MDVHRLSSFGLVTATLRVRLLCDKICRSDFEGIARDGARLMFECQLENWARLVDGPQLLLELARRPYWRRAWIRQELPHSHEVVYYVATRVCPGWGLFRACQVARVNDHHDLGLQEMALLAA